MEILGYVLSPEVSAFVAQQMAKIKKKFVFRNIKEHPFDSHRSLNGVQEADEHTVTIWINPSGSHLDYTIAHEIMHEVLEVEGFPSTARRKEYANDEWTAYVGSMLKSIILDVVIDSRLLLYNIIDTSRSDVVQQKVKQLERDHKLGQPSDYGPRFCLWVLNYLHAEIDPVLSCREKERLKSLIGRIFPRVKSVGEELVKTVHNTGFKKPDKTLKAMVIIRDRLRLQNRCLITDREGKTY